MKTNRSPIKSKITKLFGILVTVLTLLLGSVQAATLTVTNTNDSGAGSLRGAMASAAPGDTIVFDTAGVFATPQTINQGLNIFAPGYPASVQVPCDANTPGDDIEETANPGGSSLTYDATSQRYSYTWKTEKAWKGTCRILVVRLSDGTDHFAKFRFK